MPEGRSRSFFLWCQQENNNACTLQFCGFLVCTLTRKISVQTKTSPVFIALYFSFIQRIFKFLSYWHLSLTLPPLKQWDSCFHDCYIATRLQIYNSLHKRRLYCSAVPQPTVFIFRRQKAPSSRCLPQRFYPGHESYDTPDISIFGWQDF